MKIGVTIMSKFEEFIVNLDLEKAIEACKEIILYQKVSIDEIFKMISKALDVVGKKYEEGEYFLSELIMAGEIVKEILKIIEPYCKEIEQKTIATVVLATVKGDLHDIGKNILAMLLNSSGFKVIDLGVDVPAENIVKAAEENNANIIGLSALLTTTLPEFQNVINELKKAGIRNKVKVMVGGAAVNEEVMKFGVDAWGKTAVDGVKICKRWISEIE
jgi:methylmalonyl-CoA mutase cobalamin-binding domain/chain